MKGYHQIEAPYPEVLKAGDTRSFSIFTQKDEWIYFQSMLHFDIIDDMSKLLLVWVRMKTNDFQNIKNVDNGEFNVEAVTPLHEEVDSLKVRFAPQEALPLLVLNNQEGIRLSVNVWESILNRMLV